MDMLYLKNMLKNEIVACKLKSQILIIFFLPTVQEFFPIFKTSLVQLMVSIGQLKLNFKGVELKKNQKTNHTVVKYTSDFFFVLCSNLKKKYSRSKFE